LPSDATTFSESRERAWPVRVLGLEGSSVTENRLAERAFTALAVIFMVVSIGQALLALAPVPIAAARWEAQRIRGRSGQHARSLSDSIAAAMDNRLYRSWWAGRRPLWLTGDSYLQALSMRPLTQTLGSAIGAVVLHEQSSGTRFVRVIMPNDDPASKAALIGTILAAEFTRADGSVASLKVGNPGIRVQSLTGLPVEQRPYWPLLSQAQLASILQTTKLREVIPHMFVAVQSGPSGTWVVYARPAPKGPALRDFYLIPVEIAPANGEGR
jgi:hypothetical protein